MTTTLAESVWDVVHRLAAKDDRIVFIGSDLNPTILAEMRAELPDQFMMEGISEQHLVGMAAGMAMEGAYPVISTISTFLTRRCFEQLAMDIGLHRLPAMLLGTGPGVAYHFFGPTHCAVDDFALLRTIPGIVLLSPGSMAEASYLLEEAITTNRFAYLRVPRPDYTLLTGPIPVIGQPVSLREGTDVLVLVAGALTPNALEAAEKLEAAGISAGVVHFHTIQPIDTGRLLQFIHGAKKVVTVEEHLRDGGLGTELLNALADHPDPHHPTVVRLGLPDRFVEGYGTWFDAIAAAGLDTASLTQTLRDIATSTQKGTPWTSGS